MSYPKTNQTRSGTIQSVSGNRKPQRGASRSNQQASNAAKSSAFAGSDNYPSGTSKNATNRVRPSAEGQHERGYVPVGGPSPKPRTVAKTIRRVKG